MVRHRERYDHRTAGTGGCGRGAPDLYEGRSCLNNQNMVPDLKLPPGCSTPQVDKKDSTISFSVSCDTQGMKKMTTSGHVTLFRRYTMDGVSTSQVSVGGMNMDSNTQISGKISRSLR